MYVQTNMPTRSRSEEIETVLVRSGTYQAFALAFSFPNNDIRQRLAGAPAPFALPADDMGQRYNEVFGHTARGLVSPYETEYGGDANLFLPTHELSDVGAFFSAFRLKLNAKAHERADHVRAECEFLAFLTRKEAYGIETGVETMLLETRKAERLFLRDHLGRFVPAFSAQLAKADHDGFYGALAMALRDFIRTECENLGVPAGPDNLTMRLVEDDAVPAACGSCQEPCPS